MPGLFGEFELTAEELDALFAEDSQESTPPADDTNASTPAPEQTETDAESKKDNVENTKAFAQRLAEKSAKAVAAEREAIAKKMGFESYDAMMQDNDKKLMEQHGLDPDQVTPVVDELVKQRINNDPRMQELEELRAQKIQAFAKNELAEITKLTNGEITSLSQIPKPVIELWKTCGSLKAAYLQVEGENLIAKARAEHSRGTTTHLATPTPGSSAISGNKRLLTEQEKAAWKIFYPNMSQEELNKMTVDK